MTPEERLIKALFGGKYPPKFKTKKDQEQYELNCLTIKGYENLWRLVSYIPKEDREFIKTDFDVIQEMLIDNYDIKRSIEFLAKRNLKMQELNAPKIIIENEYRRFYERVIEMLNIKLTKEEIEELHKEIKNENKGE